MTSATKIGGYQ